MKCKMTCKVVLKQNEVELLKEVIEKFTPLVDIVSDNDCGVDCDMSSDYDLFDEVCAIFEVIRNGLEK